MFQLDCPRCRRSLERRIDPRLGAHWVCAACEGVAVVVRAVRKTTDAKTFASVWKDSRDVATGTLCPSCGNTMRKGSAGEGKAVTVDSCRRCQLVWFDAKEAPRVMEKPLHEPPEEEPLDPKTLRLLKEHYDGARKNAALEDNPGPLKTLFAAVGMPVEHEATPGLQRCWVTWSLGALILLIGILGKGEWQAVAERFGFVPEYFGPSDVPKLVTAFFVHGGWLHLLVNLYFFIVFGDDVEAALGKLRFLLLLGAGTVLGSALHGVFTTRPDLPVVGASDGISAVMAFYALAFPHNRVGFTVTHRGSISGRYVRMTARHAFLLWLAIQIWLIYKQLMGASNVSALAHLGGVLAGAAAWWLWQRNRT